MSMSPGIPKLVAPAWEVVEVGQTLKDAADIELFSLQPTLMWYFLPFSQVNKLLGARNAMLRFLGLLNGTAKSNLLSLGEN